MVGAHNVSCLWKQPNVIEAQQRDTWQTPTRTMLYAFYLIATTCVFIILIRVGAVLTLAITFLYELGEKIISTPIQSFFYHHIY